MLFIKNKINSSYMLTKKNLIIIGGTTGLGLSAAQAFVQQGANVLVVGRNEQSCREAQTLLGENALALAGDACHPNTSLEAIEKCVNAWGKLDGLYHVAGGSGRKMGDGPLHELSLEGWNKTFELNLTSLMLSNQAAVQQFLKQKSSGTILNMSSVLGYSPSPSYFATHAYAAAKSAVFGFSKSIASYYAANNIRVNVVAPSLIETPMSGRASKDEVIQEYIHSKQPLDGGRIGRSNDLDGIACYFMSDLSKFTTGQVVAVDGGWSVSEG
jgi:NAD(P)-dependent dehydrogenase (short-subunit alcohol dehydrogenase family)